MWKTRIKCDRKGTDFSNNPGGVKVKPKCFKFKIQSSQGGKDGFLLLSTKCCKPGEGKN